MVWPPLPVAHMLPYWSLTHHSSGKIRISKNLLPEKVQPCDKGEKEIVEVEGTSPVSTPGEAGAGGEEVPAPSTSAISAAPGSKAPEEGVGSAATATEADPGEAAAGAPAEVPAAEEHTECASRW